MVISSDANAAQSRAAGQATRFFDDIGCLASDRDSRLEGTERYVKLASGGWSTTEAAHFAKSNTARTPMDYGIVAFSSAADAQAADRDKQARSWQDIVKMVEAP